MVENNSFLNRSFSFPCPAKLNLFLYINGRREDGYHELQTLFQFLDFSDQLTVTINNSGNITLENQLDDVVLEDNLIFRAAKLLQQYTQTSLGASLSIEKKLPMGGGVGGQIVRPLSGSRGEAVPVDIPAGKSGADSGGTGEPAPQVPGDHG